MARKEFCNSKFYKKCRNELNTQKYILKIQIKQYGSYNDNKKKKIDELKNNETMTRKEEIKIAAVDYVRLSNRICPDEKSFFDGAEWADNNPKSPWISVEDDLPCNNEELTHSNYTDRVLISARNGFAEVAFMSIIEDAWEWATPIKVSHWMPIPKLPEQIKD